MGCYNAFTEKRNFVSNPCTNSQEVFKAGKLYVNWCRTCLELYNKSQPIQFPAIHIGADIGRIRPEYIHRFNQVNAAKNGTEAKVEDILKRRNSKKLKT